MTRIDVKPLPDYSGRVEPWLQAERLIGLLKTISVIYRTLEGYEHIAVDIDAIVDQLEQGAVARQEKALNSATR